MDHLLFRFARFTARVVQQKIAVIGFVGLLANTLISAAIVSPLQAATYQGDLPAITRVDAIGTPVKVQYITSRNTSLPQGFRIVAYRFRITHPHQATASHSCIISASVLNQWNAKPSTKLGNGRPRSTSLSTTCGGKSQSFQPGVADLVQGQAIAVLVNKAASYKLMPTATDVTVQQKGAGAQVIRSSWSSAVRLHHVLPPAAPEHIMATPGKQQLHVSWDYPRSSHGGTISHYEARLSTGQSCLQELKRACTFTGLSAGATLTASVRAKNQAGWGPWAKSDPATVFLKPSSPTAISVQAHPQYVRVMWQPPQRAHPQKDLQYQVRLNSAVGRTLCRTAHHSCELSWIDLPLGATLRFFLTAKNAAGEGTGSYSSTFTTSKRYPKLIRSQLLKKAKVKKVKLSLPSKGKKVRISWSTAAQPVPQAMPTGYRVMTRLSRGKKKTAWKTLAIVGHPQQKSLTRSAKVVRSLIKSKKPHRYRIQFGVQTRTTQGWTPIKRAPLKLRFKQ